MPRRTQTTDRRINHDRFKDHVTKKKIDQHLSDINDTISEEDIRNIKTDITDIISADHIEPEKIKTEKIEADEENDVHHENKPELIKKGKAISPWNILEEPS